MAIKPSRPSPLLPRSRARASSSSPFQRGSGAQGSASLLFFSLFHRRERARTLATAARPSFPSRPIKALGVRASARVSLPPPLHQIPSPSFLSRRGEVSRRFCHGRRVKEITVVAVVPSPPRREVQEHAGLSTGSFPPLDRRPRHCIIFLPEALLLRRAPPLRVLLPATSSTVAPSSTRTRGSASPPSSLS